LVDFLYFKINNFNNKIFNNFKINREGYWKSFKIYRDDNLVEVNKFKIVRSPLGWNQTSYILFSSNWNTPALPDTQIYIDEVGVFNNKNEIIPNIKNGIDIISGNNIASFSNQNVKKLFRTTAPNAIQRHYAIIERKTVNSNPTKKFDPFVHLINTFNDQNGNFLIKNTSSLSNWKTVSIKNNFNYKENKIVIDLPTLKNDMQEVILNYLFLFFNI
jgi:hypothetical protein